MKKNLPVFQFVIDDSAEAGVKAVSIVADPAFGSGLIAFAKDKPKLIVFADKKKQIVAGLSLIPDVPVYRYDAENDFEYYGYFTADVIEQIVQKYHEEMLQNKVNVNHDDSAFIDAYMIEDFIVNSEGRKADLNKMGIDHKNIMGSWYTAFKIKDLQIFQNIVNSGTATGFSVEAFLDRVTSDFNKEVKNKYINNNVEMKKISKTIKEKILSIFTEIEKFERVLVPELAFEIEYAGVGEPVNKIIVDQNGNETLQPVGAGEFATESGIVIVDEQSNLVEIRELPAQPKVDAVETPEVPITSGSTSGDTSLAVSGATSTPAVPAITGVTDNTMPMISTSGSTAQAVIDDELACKKKKLDEEAALASGTTSGTTDGLNKTIKELCPVAGDYVITVCVDDQGNICEATVTSQKDLLPEQPEIGDMKSAFSIKVKNAFARIIELEAKMKEPISDPILAPEPKQLSQSEFSKLTPFQKSMYNRGLQY